MLSNEQILAAKAEYGTHKQAAAALGIPASTFSDALKRAQRGGPPSAGGKPLGKSLADFRAEFDKGYIIPNRIREGLKQLGDGWETEVAFAKLCGVSLAELGNYREQFVDHFVVLGRTGRRAWAGSKKTAEAMRSMV